MNNVLEAVAGGLFVILIIGLIKPALVIKWVEKPTRLKVFGYWFFLTLVLGTIGAFVEIEQEKNISKIELAKQYYENGNFDSTISVIKRIKSDDISFQK